jgi:hypothetical protein
MSQEPLDGQFMIISNGLLGAMSSLGCNISTRHHWNDILRLACSSSWIGLRRKEERGWVPVWQVAMRAPFQIPSDIECKIERLSLFFRSCSRGSTHDPSHKHNQRGEKTKH